jgi:hypothetical protein
MNERDNFQMPVVLQCKMCQFLCKIDYFPTDHTKLNLCATLAKAGNIDHEIDTHQDLKNEIENRVSFGLSISMHQTTAARRSEWPDVILKGQFSSAI